MRPRSRYNTGLTYVYHNEVEKLNVIYDFYIHRVRMKTIAKKYNMNYNTLRNILNAFKNESGVKYKYKKFDIDNPILIE